MQLRENLDISDTIQSINKVCVRGAYGLKSYLKGLGKTNHLYNNVIAVIG